MQTPPLQLPAEQVRSIRAAGEAAFPHECCGFLMGKVDAMARKVMRVVPVENARPDGERSNRYTIRPDDFLRAEQLAREAHLEILGFYHSHPDAPARPSTYDLEHAWPWYSYVIVSILAGHAEALTCWVLRNDRSHFDEQHLLEN